MREGRKDLCPQPTTPSNDRQWLRAVIIVLVSLGSASPAVTYGDRSTASVNTPVDTCRTEIRRTGEAVKSETPGPGYTCVRFQLVSMWFRSMHMSAPTARQSNGSEEILFFLGKTCVAVTFPPETQIPLNRDLPECKRAPVSKARSRPYVLLLHHTRIPTSRLEYPAQLLSACVSTSPSSQHISQRSPWPARRLVPSPS
jgi:hypothetical protein